jgi:NAD(P)-dependent dehydrogenase (short-subunit alcohol dehydrogenase family)
MTHSREEKYQSPVKAIYTGIADLFKKNERIGTLSNDDRLDNKRVLITGSSSGLGLATAIELASLGAEVVMAVRSGIPEKGELVKKKSGSQKVHMLHVDLSDAESIKEFVAEFKSVFGTADIFISNAAMVAKQSRKTPQGLEQMFMVNYMAKFLLVNALIAGNCIVSRDGTLPRIIFVTSESHRNPKEFDWEGFGKYCEWGIGKSVSLYGYYKLLLVTLSNELERRLNPNETPNYSVFALCPGPVNSNIAREAPAIFKPLMRLIFSIFFRSPKRASEPVVYLATSSDMEGKNKDYLFLMSRREMDGKATDEGNGKKLWELSEELAGKL